MIVRVLGPRLTMQPQSSDEGKFIRELEGLLKNGGVLRLFSNDKAESSYFSIAFDGVTREATKSERDDILDE